MMATKSKTVKQPEVAKRTTRVEALHELLSRAGGASVDEIASAFNWARHSCRGLVSTSRSKLGWEVSTAKIAERGIVYSIAAARPKADTKAKAAAKPRGKRATRPSA
jgi:hypothetical protein